MNPDQPITYETLAKSWGVSVQLVRDLVAKKKLRALRLGHSTVRFRMVDVLKFEEANSR